MTVSSVISEIKDMDTPCNFDMATFFQNGHHEISKSTNILFKRLQILNIDSDECFMTYGPKLNFQKRWVFF